VAYLIVKRKWHNLSPFGDGGYPHPDIDGSKFSQLAQILASFDEPLPNHEDHENHEGRENHIESGSLF
jgi:hypothetical protein